jgi:hypothetical protein
MAVGAAQDKPPKVRSLERALAREWRESHGLTMAELGRGFDPPRSLQRVRDIEDQPGSMTVSLILELIRAFGRIGKPIGPAEASDYVRLSVFFGGPGADDARAAFVKAARVIVEREAGARE